MLRQNLKQLQEAQKLEKKCNDYIKQCKNQLDQLKLEYSGRSGSINCPFPLPSILLNENQTAQYCKWNS